MTFPIPYLTIKRLMFGTIEVGGLATGLLNILNIAPGENFAEGEGRGTAEIHLMYLTFCRPFLPSD